MHVVKGLDKTNEYARILSLLLAAALLFAALLLPGLPATDSDGAGSVEAFEPGDVALGAWLGRWPNDAAIRNFEKKTEKHMDVVHIFANFDHTWVDLENNVNPIYDNGSLLLLTWEPMDLTTEDINSGAHDDYMQQMAADMRDYRGGVEIWLRPMHEMNGNWYSWAIGDSDVNTDETYIAAWKRIHGIFQDAGATNVKFVWNINHVSVGEGASLTGAWPGDSYVDFPSIDGYNWGTSQSWSSWQTFPEVFTEAYDAVTGLTTKKIVIGEWASSEDGGDKAQWITDSFNEIKAGNWDQINALIWFHERKETSWPVDSSRESLEAYKQAISDM